MLYEKALQYAEDCVSGKEITTKEIIKQCQIFLDHINKQDQEEYPYFMDHKELKKIESLMKLLNFATGIDTQGKNVLEGLHNFQAFFFTNIFGFKFKDDPSKFLYKDITLFIPRKNAKTWKAGILIILFMLTGDKFDEYYSICVDRDLAGEVRKCISQIIQASPAIEKHFTVPKTITGKIVCKINGSYFQARTSESSRNNAIRPKIFIADEFASYKDKSNINAMRSGQLSTKNPRRIQLSTAYAIDQSIAFEELDYIRKCYAGTIDDPRMFAMIYYSEAHEVYEESGLYRSNPLRIEANYSEIRQSRERAKEVVGDREEYLTKHMNVFTPANSAEAYINIEDLQKCKVDHIDFTGRKVYVGLDLSISNDNCSYSMVFEQDLKIYADSFAFIPKDRKAEKNRLEKLNYDEFINAGKCFECGDLVIDYTFIQDMILQIEEKHKCEIVMIGFDRWNCLHTAQELEKAGLLTTEIKQHSSVLFPATKLLKEKILQKEFFYTENKLFEINMQNARTVEDNNKNYYVNKKKSVNKVDMVASMINAIWCLQQDVIFNAGSDWAIQVL
jgi:phage terminase large subunit-like protein